MAPPTNEGDAQHGNASARCFGSGSRARAPFTASASTPTSIVARSAAQRRLLALSAASLVVLGGYALWLLPRQEDPTLSPRFATVVAPLPGASAADVEALILEPLEAELRTVVGVKTLDSTARLGVGVVSLELVDVLGDVIGDAEADGERIFAKVRDATQAAALNFPPEAPAPTFDDQRFDAYTLIVGLRSRHRAPTPLAAAAPEGEDEAHNAAGTEHARLAIVGRYARELASRLRGLPNVKTVRIWGAPEEEIHVRYHAGDLAESGLSPEHLARAIQQADTRPVSTVLEGKRARMTVNGQGAFTTLDHLRRVPVALPGGVALRLGDLASVERAEAHPASEYVLLDGQNAVSIAVRMAPGQQVEAFTRRAEEVVSAFERVLPADIELSTRFRQASYTERRMGSLAWNLALGVLLVFGVLVLTLGVKAASIVATSLPLTALATLALLHGLSIPIHQMSVTGLIIAIGLLVDNAIVVVDSVRLEAERHAGSEAVRRTVAHLWLPLLASTLTTILAFLPIALMQGATGEFVFTIAMSVIIALACSYIVALTVTAALAGWLLTGTPSAHPPVPALRRTRGEGPQALATRAGRLFERTLQWGLRAPWVLAALAALPALLGLALTPTLTDQFFPPADRDQFTVEVFLPSHGALERTEQVVRAVDRQLRAEQDIQQVDWYLGRSAPPIYYNLKQNRDGDAAYAQAHVTVRGKLARSAALATWQHQLDEAFPEAQILVKALAQGPPVDAPLELRIEGPDLDVLRALGDSYRERLSRVGAIAHTQTTLSGGQPTLVHGTEDIAALQTGKQGGEVLRAVAARLDGLPAGLLLEDLEALPIRLRPAAITTVSDLESMRLDATPLSALGAFTIEPRLATLPRHNGQRLNAVYAFPKPGELAGNALAKLQQVLAADPVEVPAGYSVTFGGDMEKRGEAVRALVAPVLPVALGMLLVLMVALQRLRHVLIILLVALQAAGLGLLALRMSGYAFGFQSLIGLVGLIGVAINDAIVILAVLRERAALPALPQQVARLVRRDCGRHVLSTTLTTAAGFVPLLLDGGEFWPPLAVVIAGGVSLCTLTSLYFVPAAFVATAPGRRTHVRGAVHSSETQQHAGSAPAGATAKPVRGVATGSAAARAARHAALCLGVLCAAAAGALSVPQPSASAQPRPTSGATSRADLGVEDRERLSQVRWTELLEQSATQAEASDAVDASITAGTVRLGLKDAVRRALDHSPARRMTQAHAEAAGARHRAARVELYPTLDVGLHYMRLEGVRNAPLIAPPPGNAAAQAQAALVTDPAARGLLERQLANENALAEQSRIEIPRNQYGVYAQARFPLTSVIFSALPRLRAEGRQAEARQLARAAVEADVARNVALRYLDHGEAKATAFVQASHLELARLRESEAQAKLRRGLGDRGEVAIFASARAQASGALAAAEAETQASAARLALALGLGGASSPFALDPLGTLAPEAASAEATMTTDAASRDVSEASANARTDTSEARSRPELGRPELRALAHVEEAKRQQAQATIGAALPELAVVGRVDYAQPNPYFIPPNTRFESSWALMLHLDYSPNRTVSALRARAAGLAEARATAAEALEVRDAIAREQIEADAARQSAEALERAHLESAEHAKVAYEQAAKAYAAGLGEATDVVARATDLQTARLGRVRAALARARAAFHQAHARGHTWW